MEKKEAMEILKDFYDKSALPVIRTALGTLIPELESEDERIRTFLHDTFTKQYLCKDKLGKWHGEPVVNILAWLEKQQGEKILENSAKTFKDEQNPNDKTEKMKDEREKMDL